MQNIIQKALVGLKYGFSKNISYYVHPARKILWPPSWGWHVPVSKNNLCQQHPAFKVNAHWEVSLCAGGMDPDAKLNCPPSWTLLLTLDLTQQAKQRGTLLCKHELQWLIKHVSTNNNSITVESNIPFTTETTVKLKGHYN